MNPMSDAMASRILLADSTSLIPVSLAAQSNNMANDSCPAKKNGDGVRALSIGIEWDLLVTLNIPKATTPPAASNSMVFTISMRFCLFVANSYIEPQVVFVL